MTLADWGAAQIRRSFGHAIPAPGLSGRRARHASTAKRSEAVAKYGRGPGSLRAAVLFGTASRSCQVPIPGGGGLRLLDLVCVLAAAERGGVRPAASRGGAWAFHFLPAHSFRLF